MVTICFTGHRNRRCSEEQLKGIYEQYPASTWLHGGAIGFDTQVNEFSKKHEGIITEIHLPDYRKFTNNSSYAPIARNHDMVDKADIVVACWDGRVVGRTYSTILYAIKKHKIVIVLPPEDRVKPQDEWAHDS